MRPKLVVKSIEDIRNLSNQELDDLLGTSSDPEEREQIRRVWELCLTRHVTPAIKKFENLRDIDDRR